jgi:hypothetical protein
MIVDCPLVRTIGLVFEVEFCSGTLRKAFLSPLGLRKG